MKLTVGGNPPAITGRGKKVNPAIVALLENVVKTEKDKWLHVEMEEGEIAKNVYMSVRGLAKSLGHELESRVGENDLWLRRKPSTVPDPSSTEGEAPEAAVGGKRGGASH
jgi:hypothetical protein